MVKKKKRQTVRFGFTKRRLEALKSASKRFYVFDEAAPLCMSVNPSGAKVFYHYAKVHGRPQRNKIGPFPETTIEQARTAAKRLAGDVAKGRDPMAAKRTARQQPTLKDAWENFLRYAKEHKRPKSVSEDERNWNIHLKPWAGRRLASIERSEVVALHSRVGSENGHYAANRLVALLSSIYNRAADDIGYTGHNPARGIQRFKEEKRDRFLQRDELPRFFKALEAEENATLKDCVTCCLFTGARRSAVQAMKWADLDLAGGYWRIPPEDSKSGVPVIVPLSPAVAEILKRRRKADPGGAWVFPGRSRTGHVVELKTVWSRVIKAAGLEGVRPHDLRRTMASWQALLGASETLIGRTLGHAAGSPATSIYARLSLDPVRASLNAAEAAMVEAGGDAARKLLPGTNSDEANSDEVNGDEVNGEPAGD